MKVSKKKLSVALMAMMSLSVLYIVIPVYAQRGNWWNPHTLARWMEDEGAEMIEDTNTKVNKMDPLVYLTYLRTLEQGYTLDYETIEIEIIKIFR
jgi:hypothetical protein